MVVHKVPARFHLGSKAQHNTALRENRNEIYRFFQISNLAKKLICVYVLLIFQVLVAAFWDIKCSLVEVDRQFRGEFCLNHQGDR